jgi:hypothetical protein
VRRKLGVGDEKAEQTAQPEVVFDHDARRRHTGRSLREGEGAALRGGAPRTAMQGVPSDQSEASERKVGCIRFTRWPPAAEGQHVACRAASKAPLKRKCNKV